MATQKILRKPPWLCKKIELSKCAQMRQLLQGLQLHSVCQEAQCPNISECFQEGTATFLILGSICTRNCRFCAIKKGNPQPLDADEPQRIVQAVERLNLRFVVITSVTRDDLADGGAAHFAAVLRAIHVYDEDVAVEVLVPDFQAKEAAVVAVLKAEPDVFAHNVETVPRLYPTMRQGALYERSLEVLRIAKRLQPDLMTKSGLMLGAGETQQEVEQVIHDIQQTGCEFLSIGQYLAPSTNHALVKEFITPERFAAYRTWALGLGFRYVESGPYVRSSYHASRYLDSL